MDVIEIYKHGIKDGKISIANLLTKIDEFMNENILKKLGIHL